MINEDFPSDLWTHILTDGSATRAIEDRGAGILIRYPSGRNETHFMATGKRCSNYNAEAEALMKAASMIDNAPEDTTSVVFLTDARSVLEALINSTSPKLAKLMTRLSNTHNIAFQWIPAHCGVSGNEKADQLAKQGAKTEQPNTHVSYREKVTIIKAITRLNRAEQVVMARLRSGQNRLSAHLYRKYKLVPSPLCACGEEEQTTQRCKRHDQERAAKWSEDITLHRKLYGGLEDLRRTTFIAETGVIV